jgi:hypothetical protein
MRFSFPRIVPSLEIRHWKWGENYCDTVHCSYAAEINYEEFRLGTLKARSLIEDLQIAYC